MCGITGFWSKRALSYDPGGVLSGMVDAVRHRGPDDEGTWSDPANGLHFGHTRLSVLDLSDEGRQPMVSRSGRYVITYNGEVFNFEDLRRQLGPSGWRGHSDTEVMLEAIERWGVEEAATRFNGQFAFAVWDTAERVLFLARDRLGIKPLFWGRFSGTLVFGSELKALWSHPSFVRELDPSAVVEFLELGYVPSPLSIFRDVRKLPAGSILRLPEPDAEVAPSRYWSMEEIARAARSDRDPADDIIGDFDTLLRDAVRKRLVADVPVGAFLSGGIDSSLVVALMQQEAGRTVKTFSIGFENEDFDEAPYATQIARHLGTDHVNLYVSPDQIFEFLTELPRIYDEPFADESQVPTALVSRLARQTVTVCLSGDGGDELFGGYTRYRRVAEHWQRIDRMPGLLRWAARAGERTTAALERTAAGRRLTAIAARTLNPSIPLGQVSRKLALLGSDNPLSFYRRSIGLDARSMAGPRLRDVKEVEAQAGEQSVGLSLRESMMLVDALGYLPDDILVKVDRASMDVALEVRVPLLDHRVVERAWSIPEDMKVRGAETKWLLREILSRHVPRSLFERPKQGFAVPLNDWLRGPMRDWGETLLDSRAIADDGLLDPDAVSALWRDHVEARSDAKTMLWRILSLQAWLREATSEAGPRRPAPAIA